VAEEPAQQKTPLENAAKGGLRGSELHRSPAVNEEHRDLPSISGLQRRIRIDVHFHELERKLALQTLAEPAQLITQMASGPAVQFKVKRLGLHRGNTATLARPLARVNEPQREPQRCPGVVAATVQLSA
jgi:hypothetical protein